MSDDPMMVADYLSAIDFNKGLIADAFEQVAKAATKMPPPTPEEVGTRGEVVLIQARLARSYERDLERLRRGLVQAQRRQFRAEQGMGERAPIDPVLLAIRFPDRG